jgi:hypothetical protein
MHGNGRWVSADGDECYVGAWVDNQRHGAGQVTWAHNTSILRGTFRRHKRVGRGTYVIKNVLFLDATFRDNVAHGRATARWHKVAQFDGHLVRGAMHGRARFVADDGSFEFAGPFEGGVPAADATAAYVVASLDRSGVAMPAAAAAVPAAAVAPGGKGAAAAPAAKGKAPAVPDEPPEVTVRAGGDLGKLVVRAGNQVIVVWCDWPRPGLSIQPAPTPSTQDALDAEARRAHAAGMEASLQASEKGAKGAKGAAPAAGAAAAGSAATEPNPYPEPPGTHAIPHEARRAVSVRLRPLLPPPPPPPPAEASDTSIPAVAAVAAAAAPLYIPDTLVGPPVPLWVRRRTLAQCAARPGRFALASAAVVDGQLVPAPRAVLLAGPPTAVSTARTPDDGASTPATGGAAAAAAGKKKGGGGSKGAAKASTKNVAAAGADAGSGEVVSGIVFAPGPAATHVVPPARGEPAVPRGEGVALTFESLGGVSAHVLPALPPAAAPAATADADADADHVDDLAPHLAAADAYLSLAAPYAEVSSPHRGVTCYADVAFNVPALAALARAARGGEVRHRLFFSQAPNRAIDDGVFFFCHRKSRAFCTFFLAF